MTNQEAKEKAAKELGCKVTQIKSVKVMTDNVSVKLTNGELRLIPTSVWNGEVTEGAYARAKLQQSKEINARTENQIKDWIKSYSVK